MIKLGYAISSEEHHPIDIVRHAQRAEEVGFTYALISDHFHPWVSEQGHSPFVWGVLGGIAHATKTLQIGTGVTCPMIRTHPAIIAQASATTAAMMPGRFFLGLGTGENLNEHIFGDRCPAFAIRAEMLEESIEVIRLLWQGGMQSHYGKHYTVENARLYTLPDVLPPIMVAAAGPEAAELAGKLGDGLINTAPEAEVVQVFEKHGSKGRPKYGKLTVCWAETTAKARATAYKYWPTAGLKGDLSQELPTPAHFERAAQIVTEIQWLQADIELGFDHIFLHNAAANQEDFIRAFAHQVLPHLKPEKALP